MPAFRVMFVSVGLCSLSLIASGGKAAVNGQGIDGNPPVDQAAQGGFVEPQEPWVPGRGPWYLGVYGEYTSTGLLVTRVFPGTAAQRAGLEPGDRIVTVNGYQIGVVNGVRYPIDEALQLHVRRSGMVRLLVQDQRTKQLVNLDVRLTRGRVHT